MGSTFNDQRKAPGNQPTAFSYGLRRIQSLVHPDKSGYWASLSVIGASMSTQLQSGDTVQAKTSLHGTVSTVSQVSFSFFQSSILQLSSLSPVPSVSPWLPYSMQSVVPFFCHCEGVPSRWEVPAGRSGIAPRRRGNLIVFSVASVVYLLPYETRCQHR